MADNHEERFRQHEAIMAGLARQQAGVACEGAAGGRVHAASGHQHRALGRDPGWLHLHGPLATKGTIHEDL